MRREVLLTCVENGPLIDAISPTEEGLLLVTDSFSECGSLTLKLSIMRSR